SKILSQLSCGFSSLASLVVVEAALRGCRSSFNRGREARGKCRKRHGVTSALCLCLLSMMFCEVARADEPLYDIDIPATNAAQALNRFAEQTGAIMLFPYDL